MKLALKNLLLLLGLISFFGNNAFAGDHKDKPATEQSDEDVEDSCD